MLASCPPKRLQPSDFYKRNTSSALDETAKMRGVEAGIHDEKGN